MLMAHDPQAWERADEPERREIFARHAAFDRAVRQHGRMVAGEALAGAGAATTLRPAGDTRTVAEGPLVETVEQLGGFYLIDVENFDVAVELCRLLPAGYSIELRPTIAIEDYEGAGSR